MTKEQPWANRSGRYEQKSDCERFTQVAHDKRATVSKLLSSLMTKEPREWFARYSSKWLSKRATWAIWWYRSLQKSHHERMTPVAHYKRATVIDSLTSHFRSQKISDSLEKFDFSVCFWQFFGLPPPFCPYRSLLIRSLFKERLERFAPVALYKEWPLAIRSGLSWQKSNGSDSLGSFMTKSNGSESVFFMSESLFGSQKTANRSKTDELSPNPGQ